MNSTHLYVPILKWKKGEAEALKNLSDEHKKKIIPLIEITDYHDPTELFQSIEFYYPYPVYIDTLIATEDDRDFLVSIVSKFKDNNKSVYPVIYFDDLADVFEQLVTFIDRIAIRISVPEDIDGPSYSEIFKQIESLENKKCISIDIILDLGFVDKKTQANLKYSELKSVLNILKGKSFFNRIIISATSFPEDISLVPAGGISSFERYDYKIFKKILADFIELKEKFFYSDFGVTKFTETELYYALIGSKILPKVRYTTHDMYWVLKGKKDHIINSNSINYKDLAQILIKKDYYFGEHFSFGDLDIHDRAYGIKGPGNHQNWVTISANHHIAVVVEQLSMIL